MISKSIQSSPADDTCIVLCLKAPARSKRRLAAEIGDLATTAAAHLWECALEDLKNWPGSVYYSPADAEDAAWLDAQLGPGSATVLQRGDNLGERINHVDNTLRERGEKNIIFVGTDCPAMETAYLQQAASSLANHNVVLGPATDGGVVLMGASRAWPALTGLPWSTPSLYDALARLCDDQGRSVEILEPPR
jgi:glycosyltransferase A (GT-A) superfamily protein (DUF2064 family)